LIWGTKGILVSPVFRGGYRTRKGQELTSRWEETPWRLRAKAAASYPDNAPFSSTSLLAHVLGEPGEQCGKLACHLEAYKNHCESF